MSVSDVTEWDNAKDLLPKIDKTKTVIITGKRLSSKVDTKTCYLTASMHIIMCQIPNC